MRLCSKKLTFLWVRSILSNEKYKGDALLQKSFTTDFLTKKSKINEGEVPQYYVESNHEAIIAPDTFNLVQKELARRTPGRNRHSGLHIFSSKIKCGECGSWYGSKVWHSNDKYRRVIWQCNHKFDGDTKCKNWTWHANTYQWLKRTGACSVWIPSLALPMPSAARLMTCW